MPRNDPSGDIGAVARRAAAAARAKRAAASDPASVEPSTPDSAPERDTGALVGVALGAAAVAIVLTRTLFRRRR
jgi:hypothetical protein